MALLRCSAWSTLRGGDAKLGSWEYAGGRVRASVGQRRGKVNHVKTTKDVHLLVLDTLADWEPGLAIAHLNQPAPGMPSKYRVRSVGLTPEPVLTKGGLRILPELTVDQLSPEESALLILPGADIWAEQRTDPALSQASAFVKAGSRLPPSAVARSDWPAQGCSIHGAIPVTPLNFSPALATRARTTT